MNALANAAESAVELGEWEIADAMLARLREMPSLPSSLADLLALDEALLSAYRGADVEASAALASVQRQDLRSWPTGSSGCVRWS